MKDIIVEFGGWARLPAQAAIFESVFDPDHTIDGERWQSLSSKEQEGYVLRSVVDSIRDCSDNDWTHIDVFPKED